MKRFWLILLSLGLIMAFSVSAFAVDVKVGAEYYAAGLYLNKTSLYDGPLTVPAYKWEKAKVDVNHPEKSHPARWKREDPKNEKKDISVNEAGSTAFFFQRLRVGTDFIVSPCLKLVTRFDAMERIWGGQRSTPGTTLDSQSAGTRAENENIAFDYTYIDYVSPIGTFDIGYSSFGATGTVFANSSTAVGSIKYKYDFAKVPASLMLGISKIQDNSYSAVNSSVDWTDGDKDMYGIEGVYNFKNDKASGKVGAKLSYFRYADTKPSSDYINAYYQLTPYVMTQIGPVFVQAEINWGFGDKKKYDDNLGGDVKLDQLNAFIDAAANFGMFYAGGSFAYVSGDDPNTADRDEGSANNAGLDYNPCLLLFNNDVTYWAGNVYGNIYPSIYTLPQVNGTMKNAWFFQGRVGVKPTPQWDILLSVSYAFADKKPDGFTNGTYGTEIDLTGTYKITNNLSYVLGIGYLFTGDYFKRSGYAWTIPVDKKTGVVKDLPPVGAGPPPDASAVEIHDDFIIMNKLILTF